MANTKKNYSAAQSSANAYIDEFDARAQTADNPTGTPLADLQAELEDRIRREGGDHSDFQLQVLKEYARDVHNHQVTPEQARANADKMILAYGDTAATTGGVEPAVGGVEPATASSTDAVNRTKAGVR